MSSADQVSAGTQGNSQGFFGSITATWRKANERPMADYYLILGVTTAFVMLGLFMVLSASSVIAMAQQHNPFYYGRLQLVYTVVGIPIVFVCSRFSLKVYKWVAGVAMVLAILLLIIVILPIPHGPGVTLGGQTAWLQVTPTQRVQPSEFAKAALVVWSASLFAEPWRSKRLDETRILLLPYSLVAGLVLVLVALEKDYGTLAIIGVIALMQLWFAGANGRVMGVLLGLAGFAGAIVVVIKWANVELFLATRFPFLHLPVPPGASDQPDNALYALATGRWWGVGIGASRQKWGGLYSGAHTDYILAVLGEELGLFCMLLVFAMLFTLIFTGLRIARRSDQTFWRLAAAGMTSWLMVQAGVNTLVAFGMLPVLGVPFPFLSYGGSSLWSCLIAVGVLLAAARHEPDAQAALAARSKRRKTPQVAGVVVAGRKK